MSGFAREGKNDQPVLEIQNLHVHYHTTFGVAKAVNGVSFSLGLGESLGIVGESGCGKSVTARAIMGLIRKPGRVVAGSISFLGQDLLKLPEDELRRLRGKKLAMIFQDPSSSLNPAHSIGEQIKEVFRVHREVTDARIVVSELLGSGRRDSARLDDTVIELLQRVGITDAANRLNAYPHQFSGGMKQRVMISIALANKPALLIADEPTTALDVTVQLQILELLADLQREYHNAVIFITHDLRIVTTFCEYTAVMYCGQIVEKASTRELFNGPMHPYTMGLIQSRPSAQTDRTVPLPLIPGVVPNLYSLPDGCLFYDRCTEADDICANNCPELIEANPGHWVACHQVKEGLRC